MGPSLAFRLGTFLLAPLGLHRTGVTRYLFILHSVTRRRSSARTFLSFIALRDEEATVCTHQQSHYSTFLWKRKGPLGMNPNGTLEKTAHAVIC